VNRNNVVEAVFRMVIVLVLLAACQKELCYVVAKYLAVELSKDIVCNMQT